MSNQNEPEQLILKLDIPKTIWDDFLEYHSSSLAIWHEFKTMALYMIRELNYDHIGSKHIFEVIRFEQAKARGSDKFKVNNNYAPYYSRYFVMVYPEYRKCFEFRSTPVGVPHV